MLKISWTEHQTKDHQRYIKLKVQPKVREERSTIGWRQRMWIFDILWWNSLLWTTAPLMEERDEQPSERPKHIL